MVPEISVLRAEQTQDFPTFQNCPLDETKKRNKTNITCAH